MVELTIVSPCFLCGGESDMSVTVDGEVCGLCSVCWEKADIEPPEGNPDAD